MTALSVRSLSFGYPGDVPVLSDVDLTVDEGVTAVLGASGCGKTTLLRCIAGFLNPASGAIEVADRVVVGPGVAIPSRRRGVGYVPQEGALFPHLDVVANIAFGLPRRDRSKRSTRVLEMLDLVELPSVLADRYPHELSGGQQQRVALARALAPRPALVLLDEPFSSLDAGLREETGRSVVRAVRDAGAAALLVTHDQGEALSLADQVAVMESGRFRQVASPDVVYLEPADVGVATFLGHAAMIPGQADGAGRATCALGTVELRNAAAAGPVILAIRAEQIHIGGLDVDLSGVVVDASFFGHDATIRLRLDDGTVVSARMPSGSIPATGERVGLAVADAVVAFHAQSTPS